MFIWTIPIGVTFVAYIDISSHTQHTTTCSVRFETSVLIIDVSFSPTKVLKHITLLLSFKLFMLDCIQYLSSSFETQRTVTHQAKWTVCAHAGVRTTTPSCNFVFSSTTRRNYWSNQLARVRWIYSCASWRRVTGLLYADVSKNYISFILKGLMTPKYGTCDTINY